MPLFDTNLDKMISDALKRFMDDMEERLKEWAESSTNEIDFTPVTNRFLEFAQDVGKQINHEWVGSLGEIDGFSVAVRDVIGGIVSNPIVKEAAETMGVIITEPLVALLEEYATDEDIDGKEFAAAFHGVAILLTLPKLLTSALRGSAVGTVIGGVEKWFDSIYWAMGLGFLGWQTLAPLLSTGLQPNLERYYNNKFRQKRFTLDDYIYLYNAGKVTAGSVLKAGAIEGWRLNDIQTVMELSYRSPSRSEMQMLYNRGVMDEEDIRAELAKSSYNPAHIHAIVQDITTSAIDGEKMPTLSTLRKAFKEGYYSESEMTKTLRDLGYGQATINLEIALLKSEMLSKQRELSLGQIREAFTLGTISANEVTNHLHELDYSSANIAFILETWNASKKPKLLQLNKSTIIQALKAGVLSETEARLKLGSIGWSIGDQNIIIQTALSSASGVGHTVSIAILNKAYTIGAITQNDFINRLRARQISNADIQLYLSIADYERDVKLNETAIRDAYLYEAITDISARNLLSDLGYDDNEVKTYLTTWDNQRETLRVKISPANLVMFRRQNIINDNQLRAYLSSFGFSNEEIELYVQSANKSFPRELQPRDIEDLFYSGVIDTNQAKQHLTDIGYSITDADLLVKGWTKFLGESLPQPTISQYVSAYRKGVIDENELRDKLRTRGLSADNIEFYVRYATQVQTEDVKQLTKSDILSLYKSGSINYTNGLERLTGLGYSLEDSELLLASRQPDIEDTIYHIQFMNGTLSASELVTILLNEGYDINAIEAYLIAIANLSE